MMFRFNKFLFVVLISFPVVAIPNSLFYDGSNFSVKDSTGVRPIQRAFMDKELRGITAENLSKLITSGLYLSVKQFENSDDYSLKLNGRLNGGGPIMGFIAGASCLVGGSMVTIAGSITANPAIMLAGTTMIASTLVVTAAASATPGP